MKRIVIDGATSMLGLALINECISKEIEILAIVRSHSPNLWMIPKTKLVKVIECDLQRMGELQIDNDFAYEVYYHFAWSDTYRERRKDAVLQEANIKYTLDAVNLSHKLGCKLFVGAGSQAEYGRVEGIIIPTTPVNPDVAYGVAKYAAGRFAMIHCELLGMKCIWTRTFSVFGIGDNLDTLVMYTIDALLKGEKPTFTKAEQKWDFLYSKDAGHAFRLVGEKGKTGRTYCIGSGQIKPLYEYIYAIRDAIDTNLDLGIGEREYMPLQVMTLWADIGDLKRDTGFEVQYSFEEGIRETIEWYSNSKSNLCIE